MKKIFRNQSGMSLIELVVSMVFLSILGGLISSNLLQVKNKTSLTTTVDTFVSDIRNQQMKAMVGDTEGRASHENYGLYLSANQYILFHGIYTAGDSTYAQISLGDYIQITSTTFPGSQIVFTAPSGDIQGISGDNTITLKNSLSGETKVITVNRYGVITNIN